MTEQISARIEWVNQTELSELIGLSRVTLTERQRAGMPYKPGPGKTNLFYFPFCIYWEAGYIAMTTRGDTVKNGLRDQAMTYAVGRLVAARDPESVDLGIKTLMRGLGITEAEAASAFDRARGWWMATEGRIPV